MHQARNLLPAETSSDWAAAAAAAEERRATGPPNITAAPINGTNNLGEAVKRGGRGRARVQVSETDGWRVVGGKDQER